MVVKWHQSALNSLLLCVKPDLTGHEPISLQNNRGHASLIALDQKPDLSVYKLQLNTHEGKSELQLNGSLFKECNLPLINKGAQRSSFQIQLSIFSQKNEKKKTGKKTLPVPVPGLRDTSGPDESPYHYPGFSDPFDLNNFKRGKAPVFFHDILISLQPPTLHPDTTNESAESNVVIEVNYGSWQWLLELENWEWDLLVSYGLDDNPQALLMLAQQQSSGRRARADILRSLSEGLLTGQQAETALWLDELEGLSPQQLSIYSGIEALLLEKILSESGVSIPAISHLQTNPSEYLQQLQRLIFFLSEQRSLEHLLELLGDLPQTLISELTALDNQQADDADSFSARISENIGYLWTLISDIVVYNNLAYNIAAYNRLPQPTATYTPTPVQAATGTGTVSSASVTPSKTNSATTASITTSSDGAVSSFADGKDTSGLEPPDEDKTVPAKHAASVRDLAYYVNQPLKMDNHKGDEIDGVIQFLNQVGMKDHLDSLLEQLKFGKKPLSIPGILKILLKKGYLSKGFLLTFIWLTKRNDEKFRELLENTEGGLLIIKQLETSEAGGFHIIRAFLQHEQTPTTDTKGINKELLDLLEQIAIPAHIPEADPQWLEDGLFKLSIFHDHYRRNQESEIVNWRIKLFTARPLPDFLKWVDESCVFELKSEYLLSEAIEFFQIWVEAGISTLKRKGDQLILNPYADEPSLTPMQFVDVLLEYVNNFSAIDLANLLGISDGEVLNNGFSEGLLQNIRSKHRTRQDWLTFFSRLHNVSQGLCTRHDIIFESWRYELKETAKGHYLERSDSPTLKTISSGESVDCTHPISQLNNLIANTVMLAHSIIALLEKDDTGTMSDIYSAALNLIQLKSAGEIGTELWDHQDLTAYQYLKDTPFYRPLQLSEAVLALLNLIQDQNHQRAAKAQLHINYLQQLLLNDIYDFNRPLAKEMSRDAIHRAAGILVNTEKLATKLKKALHGRKYSCQYILRKLLVTDSITQGELMLSMHQMELDYLLSDFFSPLDYKLLAQYLGNSSIDSDEKEHTLLGQNDRHYPVQAYQDLKTLRALSERLERKNITLFWLKRWAERSKAVTGQIKYEEESVFTFLLSMFLYWIPEKYQILANRLELDAEPPEDWVLDPVEIVCPGGNDCALLPVNVLELASYYVLPDVLITSCHCDACGACLFKIDYRSGERIVNQPVIRHCNQHKMDICENCLNQPCFLQGCGKPVKYMQIIRRNIKRRDPTSSEERQIRCDHCLKVLADIQVQPNPQEPATNSDGDRITVKKGNHYFLHCTRGHDSCQSCLLAFRYNLPFLSPEFDYCRTSKNSKSCVVCNGPIPFRDVVHKVVIQSYLHYAHRHCIPTQISYIEPKPAAKPLSSVQPKEDAKSPSDTCIICMDRKRTHAFLHDDSMHFAACETCAKKVKESDGPSFCPYCNQELTGVKVVKQFR